MDAVAARAALGHWVRANPVVVDACVALALLGLTVAQAADQGLDGNAKRFLLLAPAVTMPLAWRRQGPLLVAGAVSLAVTVQSLVTVPLPVFGEFLAVMLAAYSVAAHAKRRAALLGLAAVAVAVAVQGWREPSSDWALEPVYGIVYFGGAWLLGRATRRRRMNVAELARRAEALERDREHRARLAVAEERARIARELHDVVSHCLSVIVVQAGAAQEIAERDPARAGEALRSIRSVGNDAMGEMRRLLGVLREAGDELSLAPQPGMARLEELVRQAADGGLVVDVSVEGPQRPLPPGVDLAAYRVAQEALTNVRKHAGTSAARLSVRYLPDAIELAVVDRGRGVVDAGTNGGHGLLGMRERVALYGGTLAAGEPVEGGFAVRATIPLDGSAR